jgi:hypothetical protein
MVFCRKRRAEENELREKPVKPGEIGHTPTQCTGLARRLGYLPAIMVLPLPIGRRLGSRRGMRVAQVVNVAINAATRKAHHFVGGFGMRGFIILAVILLVFALVGWISFSKGPDRASINLESDRIRQDTKQVMESGAELLHKAGDEIGDEIEAETNKKPDRTSSNTDAAAHVAR